MNAMHGTRTGAAGVRPLNGYGRGKPATTTPAQTEDLAQRARDARQALLDQRAREEITRHERELARRRQELERRWQTWLDWAARMAPDLAGELEIDEDGRTARWQMLEFRQMSVRRENAVTTWIVGRVRCSACFQEINSSGAVATMADLGFWLHDDECVRKTHCRGPAATCRECRSAETAVELPAVPTEA